MIDRLFWTFEIFWCEIAKFCWQHICKYYMRYSGLSSELATGCYFEEMTAPAQQAWRYDCETKAPNASQIAPKPHAMAWDGLEPLHSPLPSGPVTTLAYLHSASPPCCTYLSSSITMGPWPSDYHPASPPGNKCLESSTTGQSLCFSFYDTMMILMIFVYLVPTHLVFLKNLLSIILKSVPQFQ